MAFQLPLSSDHILTGPQSREVWTAQKSTLSKALQARPLRGIPREMGLCMILPVSPRRLPRWHFLVLFLTTTTPCIAGARLLGDHRTHGSDAERSFLMSQEQSSEGDFATTHPVDYSDHNSRVAAAAKSLQSCPTLCDPIDSSPPGSPDPGILQAGTLEWVAISFSNA